MSQMPTTLKEAQRLLEIPVNTRYFKNLNDPIDLFLDTDNRLMRVVQIDKDTYRKISEE